MKVKALADMSVQLMGNATSGFVNRFALICFEFNLIIELIIFIR